MSQKVFENLQAGDKVLWDGKKQPLTVTAGYVEEHEHSIIMIEGPRGGEKMLIQNSHNPDRIAVESWSLNGESQWINNLRKVE